VRVDEAGHQQEWPLRVRLAGAAARIAVDEPPDNAVGDQRIATNAGIGQLCAVRLGTDPSREAKRCKGIGVEIT